MTISALRPAYRVENSEILITGGAGFIGASLARELLGRGNRITLFDKTFHRDTPAGKQGLLNQPSVRLVEGDLLSPNSLKLLGTGFHHIVHTAALLGIQRVVDEPVATLDVNITGTKHCLEFAATQTSLKRFLFFSTSEVYGAQADAIREDDNLVLETNSLRWGYAASKIAGEFYARAYRAKFKVPIVIVRPFNVYGPSRTGSNAMTTMIATALRGEELYVTGDGSQIRAWCHIDDFVDALVRTLGSDRAVGQAFNIGDDRAPLSMLSLAERIVRVTNSKSSIRVLRDSVPDVKMRTPSIARARDLLAFEPKVDLDTGIQSVARDLAATPTGTRDWMSG